MRTRSRSTPGTALRSPAGKNAGSTRRHWCSMEKKMNAAVTVPAMPVMPNIARSDRAGEKKPNRMGSRTPQMIPARTHPQSVIAV